MEFRPWPKIPRLNRDMTITEKLDGTNACVVIGDVFMGVDTVRTVVGTQSRNRIITRESDNYGFAQWAHSHRHELGEIMTPGYHYGEWVGPGIQGNPYGLVERRFYQFNPDAPYDIAIGLGVVPCLYVGPFDLLEVDQQLHWLRVHGSRLGCGYAEGVIVYHHAAHMSFKATCYLDEQPKSGA